MPRGRLYSDQSALTHVLCKLARGEVLNSSDRPQLLQLSRPDLRAILEEYGVAVRSARAQKSVQVRPRSAVLTHC